MLAITLLLFGQSAPPKDAAALLRMVEAAYGRLTSYGDTGTSTSESTGHRQVVTFTTRFQRPQRFFFEYRSKLQPFSSGDRMVIWPGTGGQYQTWWTIEKSVEKRTLAMSIAAATGVSQSTAYNIPCILMPKLMGSRLTVFNSPKIVGTGKQDGVLCDKVKGESVMGPSVLWIDRTSRLIRRIEDTYTVDPKQMEAMFDAAGQPEAKGMMPKTAMAFTTVTVYKPVANPKFSDASFSFKPPSG